VTQIKGAGRIEGKLAADQRDIGGRSREAVQGHFEHLPHARGAFANTAVTSVTARERVPQ